MMKTGGPPSWGSGAKSAAGVATGGQSCVWFTMAQGCITETYYPRPDMAQIRRMFLVVTGERGFFSDEQLDTDHTIRLPEPGVPLFETHSRCRQNRYGISKVTFTDPFRDVLLQQVEFESLSGEMFHIWVFLSPGIGNQAYGNNALIDAPTNSLIAKRADFALALKASCGFSKLGCAFQDPDDPWHQLKCGRPVTELSARLNDGNVILVGELNPLGNKGRCSLAVGFAEAADEAVRKASESLSQDADELAAAYRRGWQEYRRGCANLSAISRPGLYETSVAALKTHQSKTPPGGVVASLAVPWGEIEQQILDFRYQLSWTRDAVESASAFIAIDDLNSAKAAWNFLVRTQHEDGHWPQNMWLDGTAHWSGIQMDETGLPILLADLLRRYHSLQPADAWPTVRRAAAYLIQNGPGTEEDRWEDDGGYSPYTLAIEIAALLAAADFARLVHEPEIGNYMAAVADFWNDNIEFWTLIDGHYVRLSTAKKNRAGEIRRTVLAKETHRHSPAALALVRFGLRSADDPRILSTLSDIDRHLKSDTATGPVWHRYPDDHYGEYDDGRSFDGDGRGRGWPLLAAERAHYEIARGNLAEAQRLLQTVEKQTSTCGFIPEQVWDSSDLPEFGLFSGRPCGSAMPLVWAHAEYIKLLRSLSDGRVFDMPPQTVERYQRRRIKSSHALWNPDHKICSLSSGKILRIQARQSANIYWTRDEWKTVENVCTKDSQLGVYYADLPTAELPQGSRIGMTFRWDDGRWENRAYELTIE